MGYSWWSLFESHFFRFTRAYARPKLVFSSVALLNLRLSPSLSLSLAELLLPASGTTLEFSLRFTGDRDWSESAPIFSFSSMFMIFFFDRSKSESSSIPFLHLYYLVASPILLFVLCRSNVCRGILSGGLLSTALSLGFGCLVILLLVVAGTQTRQKWNFYFYFIPPCFL